MPYNNSSNDTGDDPDFFNGDKEDLLFAKQLMALDSDDDSSKNERPLKDISDILGDDDEDDFDQGGSGDEYVKDFSPEDSIEDLASDITEAPKPKPAYDDDDLGDLDDDLDDDDYDYEDDDDDLDDEDDDEYFAKYATDSSAPVASKPAPTPTPEPRREQPVPRGESPQGQNSRHARRERQQSSAEAPRAVRQGEAPDPAPGTAPVEPAAQAEREPAPVRQAPIPAAKSAKEHDELVANIVRIVVAYNNLNLSEKEVVGKILSMSPEGTPDEVSFVKSVLGTSKVFDEAIKVLIEIKPLDGAEKAFRVMELGNNVQRELGILTGCLIENVPDALTNSAVGGIQYCRALVVAAEEVSEDSMAYVKATSEVLDCVEK